MATLAQNSTTKILTNMIRTFKTQKEATKFYKHTWQWILNNCQKVAYVYTIKGKNYWEIYDRYDKSGHFRKLPLRTHTGGTHNE